MTETAIGSVRALAAEFIGACALISIGAGAATALGANHDPAVAFAHGLTIPVFVAALFANTAAAMTGVPEEIQRRWIAHCAKADPAFGEGLVRALGLDVKRAAE